MINGMYFIGFSAHTIHVWEKNQIVARPPALARRFPTRAAATRDVWERRRLVLLATITAHNWNIRNIAYMYLYSHSLHMSPHITLRLMPLEKKIYFLAITSRNFSSQIAAPSKPIVRTINSAWLHSSYVFECVCLFVPVIDSAGSNQLFSTNVHFFSSPFGCDGTLVIIM